MHHLEQALTRKKSSGSWLSLLKDGRKGGNSKSTSAAAAEPSPATTETHHAVPAGEEIPEEARNKPSRTTSGGSLLDWKGKAKKEMPRSYGLGKSDSAGPAVTIEVTTTRADDDSLPLSSPSSTAVSSFPSSSTSVSSFPSSSSLSSSSRSTSARSSMDRSVNGSPAIDRSVRDDDTPLALQTADSLRIHRKAKEASSKQLDGISLVPQLKLRIEPPVPGLEGSDRTSGASSRTCSSGSEGGSTTASSGRHGTNVATSASGTSSSSRSSTGGGNRDRERHREGDRPLRVVSLLGAATEVVATLGLQHLLVGRSHECKFPPSVLALPCVTAPALGPEQVLQSCGTGHDRLSERVRKGLSRYHVDVEAIKRLQPDVIITQDACDVCLVTLSDLEAACNDYFRQRDDAGSACHVVSLKPITVSDVWDNMVQIAAAVGHREKGCVLVQTLKARWSLVRRQVPLRGSAPRLRVVCLQWLHPLMGAGFWVPEIVACAGGKSLSGKPGERTAMLSLETLLSLDPDVIIAMCCGLSMEAVLRKFLNSDDLPQWNRLRAVQTDAVFVADGDRYFNNSGPTIVESAEIMVEILHARRFPHHRTASNRAVAAGSADGGAADASPSSNRLLGRGHVAAGADFPEIEIKYEGRAYAQLTGGCVGAWRALLGDGGGADRAGGDWGKLDAGKGADGRTAKGAREAAREAALVAKAAGKQQLGQEQQSNKAEIGGNEAIAPLRPPPGYTGNVTSKSSTSATAAAAATSPASQTGSMSESSATSAPKPLAPLPSPPGRSSRRQLWGLKRGTERKEGADAEAKGEEEEMVEQQRMREEEERVEREKSEQDRIQQQFLTQLKLEEGLQLLATQPGAAQLPPEQQQQQQQQLGEAEEEQETLPTSPSASPPPPAISLSGAALKAAQLRALFLATIEESLPADCLLLSGGLASTIIAHAATSLIWPGSIGAAITVLASPRAADRAPAAAAARGCQLGGGMGGGGSGGHVFVGGGPGFQPEHLLETELRFVVRVLKSFDPAEIRMGVVLAAGLREAKRQGFCSVMVGDGADELFTAFDFMVRMSDAKLQECRQHMVDVLRFPCRDLAQALGLEVRQPFLHPALQEFALGLTKDELLGEGRSEEWCDYNEGNLLLRMAFPEVVSARRPKDPIEVGAGTVALTRHFARRMGREEFQAERQRVKREDQVRIRDPEHLHYYRAFRQVFGGPLLPGVQRWQPNACSACGFPPLFPDQLLCATCGECSTRKPSRRRSNSGGTNNAVGAGAAGAAGEVGSGGDGLGGVGVGGMEGPHVRVQLGGISSSAGGRPRLSDVPRSPRRPSTPPRGSSSPSPGSSSSSSGRKQRGCWGSAAGEGGAVGGREAFGVSERDGCMMQGERERFGEGGEWGGEQVVVVEVAEEVCVAMSVVDQALAGVASPDRTLAAKHTDGTSSSNCTSGGSSSCSSGGGSNSSSSSGGNGGSSSNSSSNAHPMSKIHSLLFSTYSHPPNAPSLHHSDSLLSLVACVDGGLSVWGDIIGSSQCSEEPEGDSDDNGRDNNEEKERCRSEGGERRGNRRGGRGRRAGERGVVTAGGSMDGSDREDVDAITEGTEMWSVTDATTDVAGFSESEEWGDGEDRDGAHEGLSSSGSFSDCARGGGEKYFVLGGDEWADGGQGSGRFLTKGAEAAPKYRVLVAESAAKPSFQHHQLSNASSRFY
ncbi:hypothetical protein CLOP_g18551 [Closterium sp. NIES-67]|nr:hypothetical protein CLOP_g18551 [Closterium sp. NIES-67]